MSKGEREARGRSCRRVAYLLAMLVLFSSCGKPETEATTVLPNNGVTDVVVLGPNGADSDQASIVIESEAPSIVPDGIPDEGQETAPPILSHAEDYVYYQNLNADVTGWVSIPSTRIEYPVLHASDNDYYLTRTVEGRDSKAGSIFLDYRNEDPVTDKHIIIYGHNMRNGTMFHDLQQYKHEEFFQNNRDIRLYFGNTEMRFEIYAAYIVNIDNDFIRTNFANDDQFLQYMNDYRALSKWEPKPQIELNKNDQILTLATCTYEYDNSRFVVQARRVG